jgi:hypothetical protein
VINRIKQDKGKEEMMGEGWTKDSRRTLQKKRKTYSF